MTERRRSAPIALCLSFAILHAILLFGLIPALSPKIRPLYNQNLYADGYDELATNLIQGHGYRFYSDTAKTLMREPGYPVFLAGIFVIFRYSFTAVKIANMLLALAAAWMIILIAGRILINKVMILLPALLFLFHPGTLIAESRGGVEMLFTFFLTLYILAVYRALESKKPTDFLLSGFALGLAVLVKSTPLMFPLFLFPYLMIFRRQDYPKFSACTNVLLMVLGTFAVMSPWIVRNYALTGKFVPTASVLGTSAHAGQFICANLSNDSWARLDRQAAQERKKLARELGYPFKEEESFYYPVFYSTDDELNFSSYLLTRVVNEYRSSPILLVKAVGYNLLNLWFAGKTRDSTVMNVIAQAPYLVLAMIGTAVSIRKREFHMIAPVILLILYMAGVYAAILAQARYSVPLIPFVSILSCIALCTMESSLTLRRQRKILHSNDVSDRTGFPGSALRWEERQ